MPKRRLYSGVIDPITIIGVLFLIVTLAVGTYVAKDRGFSLNINEKAGTNACQCGSTPSGACKPCSEDQVTQQLNCPCGLKSTGLACKPCPKPQEEEPSDPGPAPITLPVVTATPIASGTCTQLCLKNATPDECGCGGTIPAGIILPPSGQTGSNSSTEMIMLEL